MKVDGLVRQAGDYALDDLIKPHTLEERIYRLRCVEAWSMVIPWVGFPLADLLKRVEPTAEREVRRLRRRCADPQQMPGQREPRARLALRRGPAARRGDAPADAAGGRPVRRDAAEPERRADPPGGAVEVRLQEHQVDRADQLHRAAAANTWKQRNRASTASTRT